MKRDRIWREKKSVQISFPRRLRVLKNIEAEMFFKCVSSSMNAIRSRIFQTAPLA